MSRVILYIASSVDGFIARNDGDVSWLDQYSGGVEDYGYADFYRKIGACIMGSKTFEKALTLNGGIDNNMPTYVVTGRRIHSPTGAEIIFYSGDVAKLVETIKEKTTKDIWLVGGGQLARSFFQQGLVDDIILSTIPVLLGGGIPLFGDLKREIILNQVKAIAFETGIVQTHYSVG